MTRLILTTLACLFISLAPAMAATEAQFRDMNNRFLSDYLQGASTRFVQATANLSKAMTARCSDATVSIKQPLRAAVTAGAGLTVLHLPVLETESRNARILFHPDPRSIAGRQLRRLMNSETTIETMQGKSVALVGLGTLDRLLGRLDEPRVCTIAMAVATELARTAQDISSAVPVFAQAVRNAGADNPLYRDQAEAAGKIIGSFATSIAAMRDLTVQPMLGESPERSRWKAAPLRRTENTFAYLQAQAAAMVAMLEAIKPQGEGDVDRATSALRFELSNVARQLGAAAAPVEEIATGEDGRGRLAALIFGLNGAEQAASRGLMQALGLQSGFNALDGD